MDSTAHVLRVVMVSVGMGVIVIVCEEQNHRFEWMEWTDDFVKFHCKQKIQLEIILHQKRWIWHTKHLWKTMNEKHSNYGWKSKWVLLLCAMLCYVLLFENVLQIRFILVQSFNSMKTASVCMCVWETERVEEGTVSEEKERKGEWARWRNRKWEKTTKRKSLKKCCCCCC